MSESSTRGGDSLKSFSIHKGENYLSYFKGEEKRQRKIDFYGGKERITGGKTVSKGGGAVKGGGTSLGGDKGGNEV